MRLGDKNTSIPNKGSSQDSREGKKIIHGVHLRKDQKISKEFSEIRPKAGGVGRC